MEKDFNILNHLVLAAKLYIYKCKLKNVNPSLQVYKAKIKGVYQIEKRIATSRNKLTKHFRKCDKLLPYVDLSMFSLTPLCFCVILSCLLFCVYIVSNRVFVVAVKIFIVEKIVLRRKKTEIVQYCN